MNPLWIILVVLGLLIFERFTTRWGWWTGLSFGSRYSDKPGWWVYRSLPRRYEYKQLGKRKKDWSPNKRSITELLQEAAREHHTSVAEDLIKLRDRLKPQLTSDEWNALVNAIHDQRMDAANVVKNTAVY